MIDSQSYYLVSGQVRTNIHTVNKLLTKPSALVCVCVHPKRMGHAFLICTQAPYGPAMVLDSVLQLSVHLG